MAYNLQSVIDFCTKFKDVTRSTTVFHDDTYNFHRWYLYKDEMKKQGGNNLPKKYNTDYDKKKLFKYICLVSSIAQYINKEAKASKKAKRRTYLDQKIKELMKIRDNYFADACIPDPTEDMVSVKTKSGFFSTTASQKSLPTQPSVVTTGPAVSTVTKAAPITITPERQKVLRFLQTTEFKEIVSYKNFLKTDDRSHTYFCCIDLSVDKVPTFESLIEDLEACQSMKDLSTCLSDFYNGEGLEGSSYEILNKGQNITTLFFSGCGAVTTSIQKINDLHNKAQRFEPQSSEAYYERSVYGIN